MEPSKKLKLLFFSLSMEAIKGFLKNFNEQCKNKAMLLVEQSDLKFKKDKNKLYRDYLNDNQIKGYSSLGKDELVSVIINHFSDDEIDKFYNEIKFKLSAEIINNTFRLLNKETKNEWIDSIEEIDDMNYTMYIQGLSWNIETKIEEEKGKYYTDCNCRIGLTGGICRHIFSLYMLLYSKEMIGIDDFPIELSIEDIKRIGEKILSLEKKFNRKLR